MTGYAETYRRSLAEPEAFWAEVAEAIARILDPSRDTQPLYELGGPQVLTYRALLLGFTVQGQGLDELANDPWKVTL